jgi:SET domain-containing protein
MAKKRVRIGRSKTGLGLFATAGIRKRTIIVYYRGKRIPTPYANSAETRDARYMFEINGRWTIDGSSRRNLGRYANHSCRPNAESDIVRGKIFLRAIKPIQPGDEITYDYGKEYFDLFIRPKGCRCVKCAEKKRKQRAAGEKTPPRKTAGSRKAKPRRALNGSRPGPHG